MIKFTLHKNYRVSRDGQKLHSILMAPPVHDCGIVDDLRSDIWEPSHVQRIVDDLNSQNISTDVGIVKLSDLVKQAKNSEIKRQCDLENAKNFFTSALDNLTKNYL